MLNHPKEVKENSFPTTATLRKVEAPRQSWERENEKRIEEENSSQLAGSFYLPTQERSLLGNRSGLIDSSIRQTEGGESRGGLDDVFASGGGGIKLALRRAATDEQTKIDDERRTAQRLAFLPSFLHSIHLWDDLICHRGR